MQCLNEIAFVIIVKFVGNTLSYITKIHKGGDCMLIRDVMDIMEPLQGYFLCGHEGNEREVTCVEVMEVPNLEDWVEKGTLVLTTFYSVKASPISQLQLIKILIEKNAAGLIVKLGRFISELPKEAIELAQKFQFPIIILPSNIPYIQVLSPIYKKLNVTNGKLMEPFSTNLPETVEQLLNELYENYGIVSYVENPEGKLLAIGHYAINDTWRNNNLLFSRHLQQDTFYDEFLYQEEVFIADKENLNRFVAPLFYKGHLYGVFHFTYRSKKQRDILTFDLMSEYIKKFQLTLLNELLALQNDLLYNRVELKELYEHQYELNHIILLHIEGPEEIYTMKHNFFIDYSLFVFKHLRLVLQSLPASKNIYFLQHPEQTCILLSFQNATTDSVIQKQLEAALMDSYIRHYVMAIGTPFKTMTELESQLDHVIKIMPIGRKLYPNERVFSYNRLGIYKFLISLSNHEQVLQYVDKILGPLDKVLLHTLEVYLSQNGNASKTAKLLYVNRRTVTLRLKKIQELCQVDLQDSESIFILNFCLKIKDIH